MPLALPMLTYRGSIFHRQRLPSCAQPWRILLICGDPLAKPYHSSMESHLRAILLRVHRRRHGSRVLLLSFKKLDNGG